MQHGLTTNNARYYQHPLSPNSGIGDDNYIHRLVRFGCEPIYYLFVIARS